ncbi:MAG TPA: DUF480 domain-containing protein [Nevskiaceae bacterium]|nr:DUF480 domain-containing protein [Nevskiaceae bacterium]
MEAFVLTPVEARAVAALVEKSIATPQYYPMTVNALRAAANQKNARSPVMALYEGEVETALRRLAELKFVARDDAGSRVAKWRQRFGAELLLKPPALAVLVALMLRGPQTLAEIRASAAVLGGPESAAEVQAVLGALADRAQPLVTAMARQPGQSAQRFAHLLCGEVVDAAPVAAALEAASAVARSAPASRIDALEARVAELERRLNDLAAALGEN